MNKNLEYFREWKKFCDSNDCQDMGCYGCKFEADCEAFEQMTEDDFEGEEIPSLLKTLEDYFDERGLSDYSDKLANGLQPYLEERGIYIIDNFEHNNFISDLKRRLKFAEVDYSDVLYDELKSEITVVLGDLYVEAWKIRDIINTTADDYDISLSSYKLDI